jgi:amino acid transporter
MITLIEFVNNSRRKIEIVIYDKLIRLIFPHKTLALEEKVDDIKKGNAFDLWSVGITCVLGGQLIGWNSTLQGGFGTFAIGQMLMSFAYICLILCLAEIASAISFSGGAYGLARVVLGFYIGFLVGFFELLQYTVYSAAAIFHISLLICENSNISLWFQPLLWIVFHAVCLATSVRGGRFMWNLNVFVALICIILVFIYFLGSLPFVDFMKNASLHRHYDASNSGNWFIGGMFIFIRILPTTSFAYKGIETLSLSASVMNNPKINLPIAMICGVLTLFITNIIITYTASSLPPGIKTLKNLLHPLDYGYSKIFNISNTEASSFIAPAQFGLALGFILPYGKLVQSLANSNLLPAFLKLNNNNNNDSNINNNDDNDDSSSQKKAIIFGACISLFFCAVGMINSSVGKNLVNIGVLSEFVTNICTLVGYIMLRMKYSSIERTFESPFGITGAVFAIVMYVLGFFFFNYLLLLFFLILLYVYSMIFFKNILKFIS